MSSRIDKVSMKLALKIIDEIAKGKMVKQVAYELGVSKETVYGALKKLPLLTYLYK